VTAGPFLHPEWVLPTLAAVALAATLVGVAARRGRGRARRLLGSRGEALASRAVRRDAVLIAALAALGLALLAPRIGERTEVATASGIDLVVLLDASRSMDAQDVAPSRLRRARRIAEDVIARLVPGDRAALAAYGDRGALLTPLTPDTDALLELIPALDTDLFRWRASRLGEGLVAALRAFDAESPRPRVVLLLGDGEDPGGEDALDAAVAALSAERVRVIAVALGTREGALVPDGDVALRDREGHDVVSRADPARLARLAAATDGELLPTDRFGAVDAPAALSRLRRDAGAAPGMRVERRVPATRVAPFAALAFVLLLAEAWPAARRREPRGASGWLRGLSRRPLAAATSALLLAVAARSAADELARAEAEVAALEAEAAQRPGDAALLLDLGLARTRAERHDEASRAFLAAALSARERELAATAYYDLGVSALARADLSGARDAFFDALALAPDDREARFNLEWTLRALSERPPPEPPPREPEAGEKKPEPGGPGAAGDAGGATGPQAPPASPGSESAQDREREAEAGEADEPAAGDDDAAAREAKQARERAPHALSPERARRLLEGVADEPGLALRQLTREDPISERMREPRGPVW